MASAPLFSCFPLYYAQVFDLWAFTVLIISLLLCVLSTLLHSSATIPPPPQHFLRRHCPGFKQSYFSVQMVQRWPVQHCQRPAEGIQRGLVPVINEIKCFAPYSKDQDAVED